MFIMLLVACGIKTIAPDKTTKPEDINMKVEDKGGGVIKDAEEDKEEAEGLEPETKIEELESTDDNKTEEENTNTNNEEAVDTDVESQDELTFIDCDEIVYATSQVNLRKGPSTDYEKVGSLSTGNSVTRTGIGTGDYENWSRVELTDGSIVYVSSNYLSTSKPVQQQQQSSTPTGSNGGSSSQQTTNGGSSNANSNLVDPSLITSGPEVFHPNEGKTQEQIDQEVQEMLERTKDEHFG